MPSQSRVQTGNVDARVPDPPGPGSPDCGQVLISLDGVDWTTERPVVSGADGWLSNADGDLLVEGWFV